MRIALSMLAALLFTTSTLHAQQPATRTLTLSAGPMSFDASGTGTATIVTLSATQALPWRWIALEGAAGYAGLPEQSGDADTRTGILEAQAQLQRPTGRIQPYLGIGGGVVSYLTNANGRKAMEPSAIGAIGVRAAMSDAWGLRLDARARGWQFAGATDWAVNSSAEITLGLSRRF